jgi:Zn-finger nucleic acid-binding protein
MTYRDSEIPCVQCKAPMTPARSEAGHDFRRCDTCGGAWMEVAAFLADFHAAHPDRHVEELMEHNDGTPRRPCPVCGETMAIAWLEFLQLDQCEPHGVWFDAGELERAMTGDVIPSEVAVALNGAAARDAARQRAKDAPPGIPITWFPT